MRTGKAYYYIALEGSEMISAEVVAVAVAEVISAKVVAEAVVEVRWSPTP